MQEEYGSLIITYCDDTALSVNFDFKYRVFMNFESLDELKVGLLKA